MEEKRRYCIFDQILAAKKICKKNLVTTLPNFFQTVALNIEFFFASHAVNRDFLYRKCL